MVVCHKNTTKNRASELKRRSLTTIPQIPEFIITCFAFQSPYADKEIKDAASSMAEEVG